MRHGDNIFTFRRTNCTFYPNSFIFHDPALCYLCIATLLHVHRVVFDVAPSLSWPLRTVQASQAASSRMSFRMTLKSRVGKGGEGITLLDGWPPGGLKSFRGRVEGYCVPLRNTDGLAPPPATLVVAKKKKNVSSGGHGGLPRPPLPAPSQTDGRHRDHTDLQTWCL